ncbi:MAG TPA: hypothetical protein VGB74_00825 [Actinoplanes sp.]|jgi:hypothetical protein
MTENPLRQRLRDALPTAMKARDRAAVAALRATIAAIDNAEAIVPADDGTRPSLAIEQLPIGVGATEVARRVLTKSDVERIVRAEIAERESAADQYEQAGRLDRADQLRAEVRALTSSMLGGVPELS